MEQKKRAKFREWWREFRPTKTIVFWSWAATAVLTMIIGFVWGGWMTGGAARTMAEDMAGDAVTERLAQICVVQFNQDPEKTVKLEDLKDASTYQRRTFVQDQDWATMPGDPRPDRAVAEKCVELLMLINP